MPTEDKKQPWLIALAIVLAAVIVSVALNQKAEDRDYGSKSGAPYMPAPTQAPVPAPSAAPSQDPSVSANTAAGYSAALLKYKDRRIQFNELCSALPNSMTFKNGTSIMLDNRFEAARTISLDNRHYTVPGEGYLIVNVSSVVLPHTIKVDCDALENVATILVQR